MNNMNPQIIPDNFLKEKLTPRLRDAHKGDFGRVLVAGGDFGMPGAPRMAAEAALRVGCGLVRVATRSEHIVCICADRPEIMITAIDDKDDLTDLFLNTTVVVVGPGLGGSDWSFELLEAALTVDMPMVVDADGLNSLPGNVEPRDNWVLTPHPGEAARLLGSDVLTVQHDRVAAVQALQEKFGGVVVLKGAGTLIATPDQGVFQCDEGNPGMATAGMGDVLSGMIGGLLAQGLSVVDAAVAGVKLHAMAGDEVAKNSGERGMLASDLFDVLGRFINDPGN